MHLCSLNAKAEPESELVLEFDREFAREDPEILQSAFRSHRRESKFFPTVSEIGDLIRAEKRYRREAAEAKQQRQERIQLEQARAAGNLVDFVDVRKLVADTIKRMPDPPALAKWHREKERQVTVEIPAVRLTPDQIAARRDVERAEIERYKANQ
jgi:hypothetical protein